MDATTESPRRVASAPALSFGEWLRQIPSAYAVLTAAVAAVAALLVPRSERLVPQPLADTAAPDLLGGLVVVVAFVLTWALRDSLLTHGRQVVLGTAVLLLVFLLLNAFLVRPVDYNQEEGITVLRGLVVDDPDEPNDVEYVVRNYGESWGALHDAYGWDFDAVAVGYLLVYALLLMGVVLSIGASGFAQPTVSPSKEAAR